jgi:uncharacterized protein YndB with AHSA1/START domain/rhodanese-related sulfurtransferase
MEPSSIDASQWMVTVTRAVPSSPWQIWRALTDPTTMGAWFGTTTSPLRVDEFSTITLLDGDIFLAQLLAADPPTSLSYVWAALGIGVENTITWRITPQGRGSRVTVTDSEPERTGDQEARDALRWREIIRRLRRHFVSAPSTVPCQDRFDASVEFAATVEGATALLFDQDMHGRWLPLAGTPLVDGAMLRVDDGLSPSVCQVTDVHADAGRHRLSCHLGHSEWQRPTRAMFEVGGRRRGAMITVRHDGWRGISADGAERQRQRIRWCKVWSTVLRQFTLLYVRERHVAAIPAHELHARMHEPGLFVFDANVPFRWEQAHLPGAIHIGHKPLSPDRLPTDKSATLVFYCLNPFCLVAHLNAGRARTLGYERVFVLNEGIEGWRDLGLPVVARDDPSGPPATTESMNTLREAVESNRSRGSRTSGTATRAAKEL